MRVECCTLAKNFAMHSVKQYQEFITDYLQSQQLGKST
jgi:hypothetical protein